ncbi:aldehyde dehydrogenase family protein [Nocardia terpenica]|uniref:aldehyde dehydrogenase family protein n=1 Tax=Nocardia terpenica TaxID=455432 RepID=UPI003A5C1B66
MGDRATVESVDKLVSRARFAQSEAATWDQKRVDDVVAAVGWACYEPQNSRVLAERSLSETRLGNFYDLYNVHRKRVLGVMEDLHGNTTVGIIDDRPNLGIYRMAKPVGVIAVASPATAPATGVACNLLPILKTRNAAIITSNPRARGVARATVSLIRRTLAHLSAPVDLVQHLEITGREATQALMSTADLVVAIGGVGTVCRAYASGTPAIGAGVGNATVIVDETAELSSAAEKIFTGAQFNNGTSCSSESNVLVHHQLADDFRQELSRRGAYLCSDTEAARLSRVLWPDGGSSRQRGIRT